MEKQPPTPTRLCLRPGAPTGFLPAALAVGAQEDYNTIMGDR